MAARTKLPEPVLPGGILMEDFMRPLGLSINALARAFAVPPNRTSAIVNGTRASSADTALRLGKYFGTSPEIWLDLQSDYELRIARQTTWTRVEPTVQTRVA
jgi:addiction module HigA family antidote